MTDDAQTEARAIAWRAEYKQPGTDRWIVRYVDDGEPKGENWRNVTPLVDATALAAKDAELAAVKEENAILHRNQSAHVNKRREYLERAERAEAELTKLRADRDSYIDSHITDVSVALDWKDRAEEAIAQAEGLMTELACRDMQLEASAKVALDLSNKLAEANKALDQIATGKHGDRSSVAAHYEEIARRARSNRGEEDNG